MITFIQIHIALIAIGYYGLNCTKRYFVKYANLILTEDERKTRFEPFWLNNTKSWWCTIILFPVLFIIMGIVVTFSHNKILKAIEDNNEETINKFRALLMPK